MTTPVDAPLSSADVQAALDAFGLGIQIRTFDTTTATSQQAADNIGCELGQIVKSLCFMVNNQPILVLTSGDQRADDRKLAELHGVGRKHVRIAAPEECVSIFGYMPGSVPPLGHRTPNLTRYIDQTLRRYDMLYAAGGAHNAIFALTFDQLVLMTAGQVADVVKTTPSV
jgi:prolyl-tRNA editing enzyme YbaK/EbsC (Cys-tRNA(Pro) deacylase)